jgi:hypothetical protein
VILSVRQKTKSRTEKNHDHSKNATMVEHKCSGHTRQKFKLSRSDPQ